MAAEHLCNMCNMYLHWSLDILFIFRSINADHMFRCLSTDIRPEVDVITIAGVLQEMFKMSYEHTPSREVALEGMTRLT